MINKIMSKLKSELQYVGVQGRKHVFKRGMSKYLFSEDELKSLVQQSCKVLRKIEETKKNS